MSDSAGTTERVGKLRVTLLRDLCIGSGNCVNLAPEVFELDDRQIVVFAKQRSEIEEGRVLEACRVCPVEALVVNDEEDSQLVP